MDIGVRAFKEGGHLVAGHHCTFFFSHHAFCILIKHRFSGLMLNMLRHMAGC